MGVNKSPDGRWIVSKRWPDGQRYRRPHPTKKRATAVLAVIESSIALGTWGKVRQELRPARTINPRIGEFFEREYMPVCESRNRRPDFQRAAGVAVIRILGDIRIKDFRRGDAYRLIERRKREGVTNATINRSLAVLKSIFTLAIDKEMIAAHPLTRFRMLPEAEYSLKLPTADEVAALVTCALELDTELAAMIAVTAETGLRLGEALRLKWVDVNLSDRLLSLEGTKSGHVRHVPLSVNAMDGLRVATRYVGVPWVFHRQGKQRKSIRKVFADVKQAAGVECRFHDLRHYRASCWVRNGVDIRTVQQMLGHADIHTTMRYSHFAPNHAIKAVRQAEELEREINRDEIGTQAG